MASSATVLAAGGGEGEHVAHAAHDHLPAHAEEIVRIFGLPITNSMLMLWIVVGIVVFIARAATKKMEMIPQGFQNGVEWVVESLYNFLEEILGSDLVKKTFWFFGGIFLIILITNWAGLFPGVGTIGLALTGENVDPHDRFRPFLRGGNADLNMTLAMSLTFAVLWFYWAIKENGVKGFFAHIFAPKGKFGGAMFIAMVVIFGMVGLIEVASILLRPVALSFRLYGNVYAGETMLESMIAMPHWSVSWLVPLPFYFLELLVGLIQALVFTLLTAVFLRLICEHDHDHDEAHH
ncbi:MAG: F0F1 ATP synthase subunit A [Verrucomicrobiota bacterium JB023]|nr:F0F1 ATP synthase subunit A [Verrucomicrobiota bacterium JB023]